jgi:hypothetical protein
MHLGFLTLRPATLHPLTLRHLRPSPACGAALVARRDAIYRIKSASFPTNGKEIMTRFDPAGATVDALAAYAFNRTSS